VIPQGLEVYIFRIVQLHKWKV